MKNIIESIPIFNQKIEQFKSSIDIIINQNNEYSNSIKKYASKTFEYEIKENQTFEEQKNEIETMLDQLEDINKRNELIVQNIEDFSNKFQTIMKEVETMKHSFIKNKDENEEKSFQMGITIYGIIEKMKKRDTQKFNEEIRRIEEEKKKKED